MRFKLDENQPLALRDRLSALGHDADTCEDEGLRGSVDGTVWTAVVADDRVLVTCDLDFSDIRLFPPGTHPGIVLFRLSLPDTDTILAAADRLFLHVPPDDLVGNLVIVEDNRIRIRRPLPGP